MLARYQNGNTVVSIDEDGSKTREWEGAAVPAHPESIDIKITDYCDLGCEYCHENSTVKGLHASIDSIEQAIRGLPPGVEIAIGGGDPLSHPRLFDVLHLLKSKGFISNITINQGHVWRNRSMIERMIEEKLVYGIGVSITSANFKPLKWVCDMSDNVVFHVIAGIHDPSIISLLSNISTNVKALILGYKRHGRGIQAHSEDIEKRIRKWRIMLPLQMGKAILSFDNLAIEQLSVKRLFSAETWERFYMGDDFTFTMYVDAVKREYAPTSRSLERHAFGDISTREYFASQK